MSVKTVLPTIGLSYARFLANCWGGLNRSRVFSGDEFGAAVSDSRIGPFPNFVFFVVCGETLIHKGAHQP